MIFDYWPIPHKPQKRYPATGGLSEENWKIHWKITLPPNMKISQGVTHPISYIGVCYTNSLQKQGVGSFDLITLLKVISKKIFKCHASKKMHRRSKTLLPKAWPKKFCALKKRGGGVAPDMDPAKENSELQASRIACKALNCVVIQAAKAM